MTPLPLLLLLSLSLQDQDPPTSPPVPPSLPGGQAKAEEPLLASDGKPVAPGRLPEDTSPEARVRWQTVLGATGADALPAILGFDLQFNVISRRAGATNELDVGIAYLEEDHPRAPFLRLFLQRKDLVSIHGPDGAWLVDGEKVQRMSGRDYQEDLRQLREYRSLAGNLLALIQPGRVRLVSLRNLQVAPTADDGDWSSRRVSFVGADPLDLPTRGMADVARKYEWVELRSPDLRVHTSDGAASNRTVYRGRLAIEPGSGQIRLAVLHAETPDQRPVPGSGLLVEVRTYKELAGGYRLPKDLKVSEVDPTTKPLTFAKRDGTDLWLMEKRSAVNPKDLTTKSFQPR